MQDKRVREEPRVAGPRLGRQNARPTIGVLVSHLIHKNDYSMWQGVVDAARKRDVNVICFVGLWLDSPYGFQAQANVIYDLVSAEKLDGVVIFGGAITQFVRPEEKRAFFERYRPLPIVTLEGHVAGIPNIYVDSFLNMRKAVLHLIQVHNYRRIAFIRGPENQWEANERYRAYVETLAEYGIPLDPALVTPPLNWYDGRQGLSWLLDHHVDFEAVIGANDDLAIGAIEELRARGIRVPEEVAVVGYDDAAQSRWITPPLTTIPIETYKWGQQALKMVLTLIEGKPVPEQLVIPTELVIRQSCGCVDPAVVQATLEPAVSLPEGSNGQMSLEAVMPDRLEAVLAEIRQTVGEQVLSIQPGQITQLWDAFMAELNNTSSGVFLRTLEQILSQTIATNGEIEGWDQVVSVLRHQALPCLHDSETLLRTENLWQQSRVLIGKTGQRLQGYRQVLAEQQMNVLREIGAELIATFDIQSLMDVLARQLPRLDIPGAYLALYENPQQPTGRARLLLAYNEQGRIEIQAGGQVFLSPQLAPEGSLPQERPYSIIVEPLYFKEDQLGFALFEMGPQDGNIYEALRGEISSALKGALLVQQAERRAHQLQLAAQVSRATSSILDVDELLPQVVELIRDRFNLYYAGLFLVDKEGEYAVLRAGTGEAGRKMLEAGHKLEVGGSSMIGWCIANQQPRITLDVGKEAVRFSNPLLPQTLSELALPLVSRGRVIGAVTIQSSQFAAFTPEDITVLQTLADQIGNAIENARLYEQSGAALQEVDTLNRRLTGQAWESYTRRTSSEQLIRITDDNQAAPAPLLDVNENLLAGQISIEPRADQQFATVTAPLMLHGLPIGALRVQTPDTNLNEDIRIVLTSVASHVAQAVENARLLEESETSLQETTSLYQASRAIMAAQTPAAVLKGITDNIVAPQLDRAILALIDPDSPRHAPTVHIAAAWERNNDQPDGIGLRWDITTVPMIGRQKIEPLVIDDVANSPELDPLSQQVFLNSLGLKALAFVPMYVGDRPLGWLLIGSQRDPYHFTDQELRRFRTMAGQATIALENRQLFHDVEARVGELTVLTRISRRLASTLNLNEVLALIADEVLNVTPATHASIALYNEDEHALEIKLVRGSTPEDEEAQMGMLLRAGTGLHGRLIDTGQSVLVGDVRNDSDYIATNEDTISEFVVPIRQGDLLLGALNLESPKPDAFDQANVRLVEALADQAAIAITNARSYEAEREAVERIRETDRLKTQFLANMSHELRTPLNSIIGFSRVIMRGIDGPLTDLQLTDLQSIYNSGQHLLGLINNVLDLSKIEAGKMEMSIELVDLHDIAKSVMSTAIALVKDKPIKLEQEVPEFLPPINADPTRVRQIILNLVSNAAKFTDQGFVRLRIVPMPTEIQISVTDSGIGIPSNKLSSIFEEFTQADASTTRRYGGTGLGLAITRKFVEMHKGRIWVESQEGVGSTFTFTLPLELPGDQGAVSLPTDLEARGEGKKLVMCIDDDPGVITLYKRYLEKQGYQVIGLTDPGKAVEEARRVLPFAITLDVLMPNRDGWSILADLKSAPDISRIPIVVCSIVQDKTKGYSLGAADYLVKPITEDELLRALERVNRDKNIHRILVVDDEPEARLLIKRILEGQTGFDIIEAPSGPAALASVVDDRPDLIILDLMMPDVDGFAVLDSVKSNPVTHHIPVIIVTAKEITEEDRQRLDGKTIALFNKGMFAAEQLMTDIANALKQMNGVEVEEEKTAAS